MNKFLMHLLPQYFDLISKGEKIYEVRLNKEKLKGIKEGDLITFSKLPENIEVITVKVLEIIKFNSFSDMANTLPHKEIGFDSKTNEEVIKVYKEIYPIDEEEKKYGVIVFKIELVK